ncbi:GGDEF domain-containing protein [Oleiphilus messinensis]|nr:GGDEF domain-containing protein [Oleiphilus messinensis]
MKAISFFWRAFPALMIFIAYFAIEHPLTHALTQNIAKALPYYLSGALILISLTFNRSRLALASVNICLAYAVIQQGLQAALTEQSNLYLYHATVILFGLHLALIGIYRERGSLTGWGIIRVFFIVSSYLLVWWIYRSGYADAVFRLALEYTHPLITDKYWITPLWLASFLFTGLILMIVAIWKRSSIEFALLVSWLTGHLVFYDFSEPLISTYLFTMLMLALFVAFVQITYDLAFVDTLTELPGRRALLEKMGTLGNRYSIAMLDVDHFKKFNDQYGHDVGDQVLKLVASKMQKVRGKGTSYRYGGEEFTVLFPGKSVNEVEPHLDELRANIEHYQMVIRDQNRSKDKKSGQNQRGQNASDKKIVQITISIGCSERTDQTPDPLEVMKVADEALYEAKGQGRNCVVCKVV